jgi:hypothetical protein
MSEQSKKLKVGVAVTVATLLLAALVASPLIWELHRITLVKAQYRLEDAVHTEVINDPVHKPTAEYVLDPPFMNRYGLNSTNYLDAEGHFAPTGVHWARWNLETRTAAILMWRRHHDLSAWRIRRTIRLIDEYYSRSSQTIPVVKVVEAATKL